MKTSTVRPEITNINDLGTVQILGKVAYRHRVFLLVLTNVITLTLWIINALPTAISNFVR